MRDIFNAGVIIFKIIVNVICLTFSYGNHTYET